MKKQVLSVLGFFVLILAFSQINVLSAPFIVQANIPFAFTIQGKNLPAGRYTIERVWSTDTDMLLIRGDQNRVETMFVSEAAREAQAAKQTELVFDKIGNHYFLRQIWTLGDTLGREIPEAKTEKEVKSASLTLTHTSVPAKS